MHSAGTETTLVRPLAIKVMDEIGVDITGQESKTLEQYLSEPFDYVTTVCDGANEACPFFPGARNRLRWSPGTPREPRAQRRNGSRSSGGCGTRSGSTSSRSS